jgi:hypothetical protein
VNVLPKRINVFICVSAAIESGSVSSWLPPRSSVVKLVSFLKIGFRRVVIVLPSWGEGGDLNNFL